MKSINRQLKSLHEHRQHVHKYLLQAIGDLLATRARRGLKTSLVKVKSHIGIRGNKIADKLAKYATQNWDVDMSGEHTEPYNDMVWLRTVVQDQEGNDCEGDFLRDTTNSLKKQYTANNDLETATRMRWWSMHGAK